MDIIYFNTLEAMSRKAALFVAETARDAVDRRGRFSLALAGGGTPRRTYELLAGIEDLPWDRTMIFFGDERCLPPDDPGSNYRMAREALLSRIRIPESNVLPLTCGPGEEPDQAARRCETALLRALGQSFGETFPPRLDLVLLGMGGDGHTASLFPGHPQLEERGRLIAAVDGRDGNPPVDRLTMTLPLLNAAQCAAFLVSGKAKLDMVEAIGRNRKSAALNWPAARVDPWGRLVWFAAREGD